MRILPLGERACLLVELESKARDLARAIEAAHPPGVEEVVASFDTVGVYYDPDRFSRAVFEQALSNLAPGASEPLEHVVPVCYAMGEDLAEVADRLGTSAEDVVRLHASVRYECFAIGFCPGFPYLGPLPDGLAGLPRRAEPRVRVPPGSVGITGRQTGIYPLERPGGWWLIGRTPFQLVDEAAGYFPISVGDSVQFEPIDAEAFARLEGGRL